MEELLHQIIEQNERMLLVMEEISGKLDTLSDIHIEITSLENVSQSIEGGLSDIGNTMTSVEEELRWYKESTTASLLLKAVEDVADAIREQ